MFFFQCKPGVAIYAMIQALTKPPTKLMILGCGCSVASIATAEVSHLFNLTQVSIKNTTVLSAKSDREVMFCLQSNQRQRIDK